MDYNETASEGQEAIVTDVTLSRAFPLAHSLKNDRRTRDELYFGDRADRDLFFNGEEGFDFIPEDAPQSSIDETAHMMCKEQREQRGVTSEDLKQKLIQQQHQQCQM